MTLSLNQAVITGGSFTTQQQYQFIQGAQGGFERLQGAAAPGAFHNSGERFDPPKCHPNTRVAVIDQIMNWILGCDPELRNALIMWLYGPAGSGKSAIAQTIAEMCDAQRRLLASFFFSRTDPSRNNAKSLMASLAYQVALNIPDVRPRIAAVVDHDPLIFTRSLEAQFSALITEPLRELTESGFFNQPNSPLLVIIDGLDECANHKVQSNILNTISKSLGQHRLPLMFLVGSRPEQDIRFTFNSLPLQSISTRLALDDSYLPDADIRLFLSDKFNEIRETHPHCNNIPSQWAREDVVEKLIEKGSGQFIYASTVIKYVSSIRHRPTDRLDVILGLRPARRDSPFAELDALYMHVFSTVEDLTAALDIICLHILEADINRSPGTYTYEIETILSLTSGDVQIILADLNSIILTFEPDRRGFGDATQRIRFLHASLPDFLFNESRSKHLFINPPLRYAQYSHLCFQYIKATQADYPSRPMNTLLPIIYGCLITHLPRAPQTAELRQDIIDLSVLPFFQGDYLMGLLFAILDAIKAHLLDDTEQLYARHLTLADDLLRPALEPYYSNEYLNHGLQVAIAWSQNHVEGHHPESWMHHVDAWTVAHVDKASRIVDSKGLRLFRPAWYSHDRRLHIFKFLNDPVRSRHRFDGHNYARAAISSLTILSDHRSYRLSFPYCNQAKSRRIYKPWAWRKTWGKHAFDLRRSPYKTLPTKLDSFDMFSTNIHETSPAVYAEITPDTYPFYPFTYSLAKNFVRQWPPVSPEEYPQSLAKTHIRPMSLFPYSIAPSNKFQSALKTLPILLKRSAKSEELGRLAVRTFAPLALLYPDKAHAARKAIEKYISQVEKEA